MELWKSLFSKSLCPWGRDVLDDHVLACQDRERPSLFLLDHRVLYLPLSPGMETWPHAFSREDKKVCCHLAASQSELSLLPLWWQARPASQSLPSRLKATFTTSYPSLWAISHLCGTSSPWEPIRNPVCPLNVTG